MKHFPILILSLLFSLSIISQTNKEIARTKATEAIALMDNGKIDESIILLKECEKLDPKNFTYPYEIAYALILKKEYKAAIKILNKTKNYKNASSQVYQASGNCYSYLGEKEKAIKEYEAGMKKFPNSGNLYLEKGNIYLEQEMYNEAIFNYEEGIKVEPMYPSNYYRLALLYLNSNDKLSGLIYGEIFMNIERTTSRTTEISKMLYDTYKKAIQFEGETTNIEFCEIIIDASDLSEDNIRLPLCAVFGKNFILDILDYKEVNLNTLSEMRIKFLNNFFTEDYKEYTNALFTYQKKLLDKELYEAYNHYLFQIGAENEFEVWLSNNKEKYDKFVDWYTTPENELILNKDNLYLKN